jgi:hypothetical protein
MAYFFGQLAGTVAELAKGQALATLAFSAQNMHGVASRMGNEASALALKLEADAPHTAMSVIMLSSLYHTDRGQWAAAITGWKRAAQLADRLGNRRRADEARTMLGWSQYNTGQFTEARACYERGGASAEKRGDGLMLVRLRLGAAECALALGNVPMLRRDIHLADAAFKQLPQQTRGSGGQNTMMRRVIRIQLQGLRAMLFLLGDTTSTHVHVGDADDPRLGLGRASVAARCAHCVHGTHTVHGSGGAS